MQKYVFLYGGTKISSLELQYLAKELSVASKTIVNRKLYYRAIQRNLNFRHCIFPSRDNWE